MYACIHTHIFACMHRLSYYIYMYVCVRIYAYPYTAKKYEE